MIAIVSYSITTHGCQIVNGKLCDWCSGAEGCQVVMFDNKAKLSPKVNAIKSIIQPIQFGNSFTSYSNFKVELLPL